MSPDGATLPLLLSAAASVGFLHTLIGVDHSLPFVVLGKAQGWSLRRTLGITALCGLAHVLTSVVLGGVGIGLGVALDKLQWIQGLRGDVTAWLLIAFGLTYTAWAVVRRQRKKRHSHPHAHSDGSLHVHGHDHQREHLHMHDAAAKRAVTAWTLFVLFAFGPCEALIPLLMAPAVGGHWMAVIGIAALFSAVTIATMLATVAVGYAGLQWKRLARLEPHAEVLAGLAIALSGFAIVGLGL